MRTVCLYVLFLFFLSFFFYNGETEAAVVVAMTAQLRTFTSHIAHFSNQFLAANNSLPRRGKFRNKILKTASVVGRKSQTELHFSSLFAQKPNTILLVASY